VPGWRGHLRRVQFEQQVRERPAVEPQHRGAIRHPHELGGDRQYERVEEHLAAPGHPGPVARDGALGPGRDEADHRLVLQVDRRDALVEGDQREARHRAGGPHAVVVPPDSSREVVQHGLPF
jgi:hypothetical protein